MVKYSKDISKEEKAARARGTHIRIHYKHAREIGNAIKGLALPKAKTYLENVLQYKQAIPFTKYIGGVGRHSQGKEHNAPGDKCGWPQKATKTFLDLLVNVGSNAIGKNLSAEKVVITHVNVQQAPKMRRRTYRAHGRINAYMSCPAHIELVVEEKNEEIVKEKEESTLKLTKKQQAQIKGRNTVKVGGGL